MPTLPHTRYSGTSKTSEPRVSGFDCFYSEFANRTSGDGITDDTAAINLAISNGGRCAPGACASSTTSPAIVYFPAGTYLISSSIIDYYYTQIIGNPNSLPILKAIANFTGFGLIDGDLYGANGLDFGATNVFYRQVRNLVFDLTGIPSSSAATGIHWPTAQATSLQNCVFRMSDAPGTQHQGIFIEQGKRHLIYQIHPTAMQREKL
jgi:glucan 1,3-beta-glucosidase